MRKLLIVGVILLLVAGAAATVVNADRLDVSAQPSQRGGLESWLFLSLRTGVIPPTTQSAQRGFEGQVTAAATGTVTIVNQRGREFTFLVTSDTVVQPEGAQIVVGARVQGVARFDSATSKWIARLLHVQSHRSFQGMVTALSGTVTRTVTLTDRRGLTFTFLATPETNILPTGAELQLGVQATVQARWDSAANNWVASKVTIERRGASKEEKNGAGSQPGDRGKDNEHGRNQGPEGGPPGRRDG